MAGSFRTVQICAHFGQIQILRNLEPAKIMLETYYEINRFLPARQLSIYYGAPDIPRNMIAAYDRLDAERSLNQESKVRINPIRN